MNSEVYLLSEFSQISAMIIDGYLELVVMSGRSSNSLGISWSKFNAVFSTTKTVELNCTLPAKLFYFWQTEKKIIDFFAARDYLLIK